MRAALLVALFALLLAAPAALAQKAGAIVIQLDPPRHALAPGDQVDVVGTATFIADPTAYASLGGVPVTYIVSKAPAWATVTVSPETDFFPAHAPTSAADFESARPIKVHVAIHSDLAPQGPLPGVVEITAITQTSMGSLSGRGSLPFMVTTGDAPCPPGTTPLRTQDASAVVTGGAWGAWAAGALAAAGLGFALALRAPRAAGSLALLALLALPVALPAASAQRSGVVVIGSVSLPDPLVPGNVTTVADQMTLETDPTAYANLIGVGYHLSVTKAPAWATVVLDHADGVFPNPPPLADASGAFTSTATFRLTILVGESDLVGYFTDRIEVSAIAEGTAGATSGRMSFPVGLHVPARCQADDAPLPTPAPAPAAPLRTAPTPPSQETPLVVQSHEARAPVGGYAFVLGCGVAGAGAGLFLSRRAQKR